MFLFFEDFVKDPFPYISQIDSRFGFKFGTNLSKYLKHERIPRSHHSESKDLQIYKKIGWVKLKDETQSKQVSEIDSYINHYRSIGVPEATIKRLIELSERYRNWKSIFSELSMSA